MKLSIVHRRLLFGAITLTTAVLVGFHYVTFGKPAEEYWWVEYGLLIFGAYIVTAYIFNWTIYLRGTVIFPAPRDRAWRIVALLTGLLIYALALYMLFFK